MTTPPGHQTATPRPARLGTRAELIEAAEAVIRLVPRGAVFVTQSQRNRATRDDAAIARLRTALTAANPAPAGTREAWDSLLADLSADGWEDPATILARHRPLIEAALRGDLVTRGEAATLAAELDERNVDRVLDEAAQREARVRAALVRLVEELPLEVDAGVNDPELTAEARRLHPLCPGPGGLCDLTYHYPMARINLARAALQEAP